VAFELRREDLSFLARAPRAHRFEARLAAPRSAVFAALADPTGWSEWFPGVRRAWYSSAPPHGVGTIREALVSGTHWVEELIAWDPDRRWAYAVTRSSVPLASAQVECFELEDAPGGTCVRWTLGFEPRLLLRVAGPLAARQMERVFVRAMRALERRLAGSQESGSGAWTPIGG
jgi:uncharacterized protein YndB with AHSA1/START domain